MVKTPSVPRLQVEFIGDPAPEVVSTLHLIDTTTDQLLAGDTKHDELVRIATVEVPILNRYLGELVAAGKIRLADDL